MFEKIVNDFGEELDYTFHESTGNLNEIVIIGHGVTGNKDRPFLIDLANGFADSGVNAMRFSFAGNGDSEGSFKDATITKEVEDLGAIIDCLDGYRITYVGHSMGGAVGVLRASRDKRITRLISLAGMVHTEAFAQREFGAETPDDGFMWGEIECPLSKVYMDDMFRLKTVVEHGRDVVVPWLLIHGTSDDVVPPSDSQDIVANADSSAAIEIIDGADHVFSEHTSEMVDIVMNWFQAQINN